MVISRHLFLICATDLKYYSRGRDMSSFVHGFRYPQVSIANLRHELYVTAVGCLDHQPGRSYPAERHPDGYNFNWHDGRILGDFAVLLISRGKGTFETRSGVQRCKAGDSVVIPPGVWHRYRPDPTTGWREHWVCANGDYLHRLRSKGCFVDEAAVLVGCAGPNALSAHGRLWRKARLSSASNDLALASEALEVFCTVLQEHQPAEPLSPAMAPTGDFVADSAKEFIWFNSHRPLTVALIAKTAGVSRRTLERRYAKANGVTVIHDVICRRVECARHLLLDTRMSVKEISYAVGFGDSRQLIRNFFRATLSTPAAFRKEAQASRGNNRI
jgi:AraC-like DNA-binding protein